MSSSPHPLASAIASPAPWTGEEARRRQSTASTWATSSAATRTVEVDGDGGGGGGGGGGDRNHTSPSSSPHGLETVAAEMGKGSEREVEIDGGAEAKTLRGGKDGSTSEAETDVEDGIGPTPSVPQDPETVDLELGGSKASSGRRSPVPIDGRPTPSSKTLSPCPTATTTKEPSAVVYISFSPDDAEDPYNWSLRRRGAIVGCCFLFATMTAINATSYGTAQYGALEDLSTTLETFLLGNTTYLSLGIAFTPLLLAPLSEIYGRKPIYLTAAVLFTLLYIPQALAPNVACLLITRFFQGCAASVGNSMVGGSVSDVFPASQRGLPMSLFCLLIYLGQSIGPVFAAYAALVSWRWIFGIQAFASLGVTSLMALLLRETRGSVLLSQRARRLTRSERQRWESERQGWAEGRRGTQGGESVEDEKEHQGEGRDVERTATPTSTLPQPSTQTSRPVIYRCRADDERTSFWSAVGVSLRRPAWWLISEPIVTAFSLWIGFLWGCIFLLLESVPIVFSAYGWTPQQRSLVLVGLGLGGVLGWLANLHQERLYARATRLARPRKPAPEARLYWSCVGAVLAPASMFMFAWTGRREVHPAAPIVTLVLFTASIYPIYLAVFSYIADVYERYASSGLAAQSWLRNVLAGTFILFTPAMYHNLSPPVASSVLGGVAAVLGVCPFVLLRYGARIRARSRVARAMEREEEREREESQHQQQQRALKR